LEAKVHQNLVSLLTRMDIEITVSTMIWSWQGLHF